MPLKLGPVKGGMKQIFSYLPYPSFLVMEWARTRQSMLVIRSGKLESARDLFLEPSRVKELI